MTADDAPLPRWGPITEPMTVLTNAAIAAFGFVLGTRLVYQAVAEGERGAASIAVGLLATALAAALGAATHGIDPGTASRARAWFWRSALYATGLIGAATVVAVAFFVTRGAMRTAILAFALLKLVAFVIRVTRHPEFRVAATDYGGALAILLAGSIYAMVQWSEPGSTWLIGGVAISLVAGVIQGRRIGLHRHFNHNDLYHVIQLVALYLFYRGGALLVDR